ncbi:MAG: cupin domain-containing protein [Thermoplasmata archaeon]|nr:MAG: cupin domain-containing protein [Thermoplasmata archaeon]HDN95842.1 cupin domain-containing protein [Thermoplasmatales archaeon]
MIVKRCDEVEMEEVKEEGAKNVYIQWLIDEKIGDNFAMRRFVIKKGGHTPLHRHDWEHEVFVLSGKGALVDENGREHPLEPGKFAYVKPNELHQFKNKGDEDFIFLCIIPLP